MRFTQGIIFLIKLYHLLLVYFITHLAICQVFCAFFLKRLCEISIREPKTPVSYMIVGDGRFAFSDGHEVDKTKIGAFHSVPHSTDRAADPLLFGGRFSCAIVISV